MSATLSAASALVDAIAALNKAKAAVEAALGTLGADGYEPPTRQQAAVRTTSTQILYALGEAREPLTLVDIADAVCAMRRGEDEPRHNGGTRYQEMCRSSLLRLIERGAVRRVPPANKEGLMRFARV